MDNVTMDQKSSNIHDFLMKQLLQALYFKKENLHAFRFSNVFRAESAIDSIFMNVQLATESFKRYYFFLTNSCIVISRHEKVTANYVP